MSQSKTLLHPSCDYLAFTLEMEFDECERFRLNIEKSLDNYRAYGIPCDSPKVEVLFHQGAQGRRLYAFNLWGSAAELVFNTRVNQLLPNITRVDFKVMFNDLTGSMVQQCAAIAMLLDPSMTVVGFNSKERQQRNGRWTGGPGVRWGAPKTDNTVTLYKKPRECGQMEVQVSGRTLRNMISKAKKASEEQPQVSAGALLTQYSIDLMTRKVRKTAGIRKALLGFLGFDVCNLVFDAEAYTMVVERDDQDEEMKAEQAEYDAEQKQMDLNNYDLDDLAW